MGILVLLVLPEEMAAECTGRILCKHVLYTLIKTVLAILIQSSLVRS